jgi:hypothetical protein
MALGSFEGVFCRDFPIGFSVWAAKAGRTINSIANAMIPATAYGPANNCRVILPEYFTTIRPKRSISNLFGFHYTQKSHKLKFNSDLITFKKPDRNRILSGIALIFFGDKRTG